MAEQPPTQKDYKEYIGEVEDALMAEKEKNRQLTKGQISMFESVDEENLIKWQLDLSSDKEKIYHLLRGDKKEEDGDGKVSWVQSKDIREIPFSDYGVNQIMQIINYYLTKNIILSNYDAQTIDWKIFDFGHALIDYFHNHYEELLRFPNFKEAREILIKRRMEERENIKEICIDFFGKSPKEEILNDFDLLNEGVENVMDEIEGIQEEYLKEKEKMIPLIHQAIVNTVHSAYNRAWRGGERESLRTARVVNQSEALSNPLPYPTTTPVRNKFSIFHPFK